METDKNFNETLRTPEADVVVFLTENKQFFLETLELSLLSEPHKRVLIATFNKFVENLKDPGLVERTMVFFDSSGLLQRVKKEDGSYDIQVAVQVLFTVDYLGGDLLGFMTENKGESKQVFSVLKEGFESFAFKN